MLAKALIQVVRLGAVVVLSIAGGFFCLMGIVVGLKVFADYKDSTDTFYILAGLVFGGGGVLLLGAAVVLLAFPRSRGSWLVLSGLALVAGLLPYSWYLGSTATALNAISLTLAAIALVLYLATRRRPTRLEG
jgi:hypothetical protein